MTFEILLILALILANGIFATAEMAVVSARKARLQQMASGGNKSAATALDLAENPDNFLSTVQVGITLIGTLAGAFGGATIAEYLTPSIAGMFADLPVMTPYAPTISLTIVVIAITYLSLIIGELTPKRIALSSPEAIASAIAPGMRMLSKIAHPVVSFLSWSTDLVMKLTPWANAAETTVSEHEIRLLIQQGTVAGTFEQAEQSLIEGVFRIGDRRVVDLMTPRHEVAWLDSNSDTASIRSLISKNSHSRFPVCEGSLDKVAGIVFVKDLFLQTAANNALDIMAALHKPLFVPEATKALEVLAMFQESGMHFAFIVNEHGGIEGILTLTDLMQAIVGRLPDPGENVEPRHIRREDGSWLIEGALSISELKEILPVTSLPREEEGVFNTLGGFVMTALGHVPRTGDVVTSGDWRFEVVDMDGIRVDEVLVSGPGHGKSMPTYE